MQTFQSVQPPSRQLAEQLTRLCPRLPRGAHVLFAGDPFPANRYFLLFLTRLLYHDLSITVDEAPPGANMPRSYDAVFRFEPGGPLWRIERCPSAPMSLSSMSKSDTLIADPSRRAD